MVDTMLMRCILAGAATSKSANDLNALRETAKAMVAAISDLLKVVKAVGDEATRGARAIDSAIAAITAAIAQMDSPEPAQGARWAGETHGAWRLGATPRPADASFGRARTRTQGQHCRTR
jgi:hypothetical protein